MLFNAFSREKQGIKDHKYALFVIVTNEQRFKILFSCKKMQHSIVRSCKHAINRQNMHKTINCH